MKCVMKHTFASFIHATEPTDADDKDGYTQHQQRAALHYLNEDDEDDYDEYEVDPKGNKENRGYQNSLSLCTSSRADPLAFCLNSKMLCYVGALVKIYRIRRVYGVMSYEMVEEHGIMFLF